MFDYPSYVPRGLPDDVIKVLFPREYREAEEREEEEWDRIHRQNEEDSDEDEENLSDD